MTPAATIAIIGATTATDSGPSLLRARAAPANRPLMQGAFSLVATRN